MSQRYSIFKRRCEQQRRCPSAHDSFTLKGSRVAAKGHSSFVFSNVPHCIAFAGSSKVVQLCKMKLRPSLIRKLEKEMVYIPSFSSLFMREMKMEKLCPDWDSCPMTLKAQKNSRILSLIAIYETSTIFFVRLLPVTAWKQ